MNWRPRFSLRTLLLLVAIVAIGCTLTMRHRAFSRRAEKHASSVANLEHELHYPYVISAGFSSPEELEEKRRELAEREAWVRQTAKVHRALSAKYRWAAKYPWLPVANDPPDVRYYYCVQWAMENGKWKYEVPPLFADEFVPPEMPNPVVIPNPAAAP